MNANLTPRAPQGPSDEELKRVPPDPVLLPFGGSSNVLFGLICGPPSPLDATMRGTRYDHRVTTIRSR
jgi:hypothetical protein